MPRGRAPPRPPSRKNTAYIRLRGLADDTEDLLGPQLLTKSSITRLYTVGLKSGPNLGYVNKIKIAKKDERGEGAGGRREGRKKRELVTPGLRRGRQEAMQLSEKIGGHDAVPFQDGTARTPRVEGGQRSRGRKECYRGWGGTAGTRRRRWRSEVGDGSCVGCEGASRLLGLVRRKGGGGGRGTFGVAGRPAGGEGLLDAGAQGHGGEADNASPRPTREALPVGVGA